MNLTDIITTKQKENIKKVYDLIHEISEGNIHEALEIAYNSYYNTVLGCVDALLDGRRSDKVEELAKTLTNHTAKLTRTMRKTAILKLHELNKLGAK